MTSGTFALVSGGVLGVLAVALVGAATPGLRRFAVPAETAGAGK
ncbi:hypothetical protein [Amycolatopsis tolypomycina]